MSDERRHHDRVTIPGGLRGEVKVYQAVTITNVGSGGLKVRTPFPLQLDSFYEFRLTLPDVSVVTKGRVVHCQMSNGGESHLSYLSGVEFVEMPQHALDAISEFVQAVRSGHAGT